MAQTAMATSEGPKKVIDVLQQLTIMLYFMQTRLIAKTVQPSQ